MPKTTSFLTGFSTLLRGRAKRVMQELLASKRKALHKGCGPEISRQLQDEISPELLERHSVSV